ncbi:MAG: peptidoglycan DD-metalloendopeptidase family protein, partial [bacterium]|nr:peptidoglycan DD-metalloendopeptidase family protein [bacterium]
TINKELSGTEKQIGDGVQKLHTLENKISSKGQKITELKNTITQLNSQLEQQQKLLATHIRARYQMGEYQPLKWLLNQNDPYKINRILTYYQYVLASRQKLITEIDVSRQNLHDSHEILHRELTENQQLKTQLILQQNKLQQTKKYHTTLIDSLNNQIQSQQHTLHDFEKDKQNLSQLLKTLAQKSIIQNSKPFVQMRKKLPRPVQTGQRSPQKMNQGVTFFAPEGTVVSAVYPGKIVFSDWLKGYGLLLIIDHGQGFMTLYAHNQSLFKRKGELVLQNEQIASVGHSGGLKQNGLYFEIRLRGKAVPPLGWFS